MKTYYVDKDCLFENLKEVRQGVKTVKVIEYRYFVNWMKFFKATFSKMTDIFKQVEIPIENEKD